WSQAPLLTGWVGGPSALRLATQSPRATVEQALDLLSRMFRLPRQELDSLIASWHFHDWQTDPFSRGAYMYVPVGECATPEKLAQPVSGTLFFAGEATEMRFAGTAGGAMKSGARAAQQVLAALS